MYTMPRITPYYCTMSRFFVNVIVSVFAETNTPDRSRIRFRLCTQAVIGKTESMYNRFLPHAYSNRGYSCSSIAYLTMLVAYTSPSAPCAEPLPISMADYFSVSRALLPRSGRKGRRSVPTAPAHLHVSCADKTNFEPPDEIRRTGCEFVIPLKGRFVIGKLSVRQ